jgi:multidrug efflux pump subunit AcrB
LLRAARLFFQKKEALAFLPSAELQALATYQLVPLLSGITGMAQAQVQGGDTTEIEVSADPRRLTAFHLTLDDLVNALRAANTLQSVGRVEDHDLLYLVMANNALHGLNDVKQTVIRAAPGAVIRLVDVADVRIGVVPQFLGVDANGKRAVTVLLYQQPGTDMVHIAGAADAASAGFAPQLPPGVTLTKSYDQSALVLAAAGSVRDAILIGIVLAAIVLLVFLRNWRITLLAIAIVPASLAAAILVLSMLGLSFNIMTLGGLAASVGLVIDDVIVMIEHIARRSTEGAAKHGRLWILGAGAEFLRPLTGSSAATLIVFAPLGFLSGVTGAVFQGAVADHDGNLAGFLGADRFGRTAAGRHADRLRALAPSRFCPRRLAGPAAWRSAAGSVSPAGAADSAGRTPARHRLVFLFACADRIHARSG